MTDFACFKLTYIIQMYKRNDGNIFYSMAVLLAKQDTSSDFFSRLQKIMPFLKLQRWINT